MFQNINVEIEDEVEETKPSSNKKEIIISRIKEIFKLRNIIYYIICFGASMISFGDTISPFGLSLLAATCSCKMPVGALYIACLAGTAVGQGRQGLLTYILTSLVFIAFSLAYRPKYENMIRNEKRKLGPHLIISTFLVQAMGLMFKTFYVYDLLTSILFTVVTYIFYKIFTNSITVVKDYRRKNSFYDRRSNGSKFIACNWSIGNWKFYYIWIFNKKYCMYFNCTGIRMEKWHTSRGYWWYNNRNGTWDNWQRRPNANCSFCSITE